MYEQILGFFGLLIIISVITIIVAFIAAAVFSFFYELDKNKPNKTKVKPKTNRYPEDYSEQFEKEAHDFKVDFNVNLSDAVVKTEVVYAE